MEEQVLKTMQEELERLGKSLSGTDAEAYVDELSRQATASGGHPVRYELRARMAAGPSRPHASAHQLARHPAHQKSTIPFK